MVGRHHQLHGPEFEQTPGVQGSLVHCSPWGHKESNMTQQLNNSKVSVQIFYFFMIQSWQVVCFQEFIHFQVTNQFVGSTQCLIVLCISMVPIVNSSLAFLILFIWVLSFFLMSVAKVLSIKSFFQKTVLSFIDLFYCLFSLCFIYFHSDLYYLQRPSVR